MIWLKYVVPLLLWTSCNSKSVCEEPPEVDFGEIVSDERAEYQSSDRVQYRCFSGYALEGPEWITCKGPQWTPPPKCLAPCTITKQQLEAKNLLLSGGRRRSIVIQNNQTVEFLCREGYVLSTPSIRKCIEGHMNLPFCISVRGQNCSRPPTIRNGDITTLSQKQYTSGSSVEFKCQRYYAMEGDSRSFCDNGNWTKVPACLEPCVILLPRIERQNISVKLRSNEDKSQTLYLPRGDSIVFSCKPGHVLATDRSQSAFEFQCRGGPVVYPECEEIICASGNIVNGYVTSLKDVYKDGDELQFECHNGYKPVDRSVAVCSENGWNTRLECTEIVCSHPQVDNGRISPHKQQYSYEETIQIQCDTHYEPEQKQATSSCTKNGWVPQPKCISKRCSYPEVENVVVYRAYWTYREQYFPKREGESIYFRCESGFLPENKEQWHLITCTKYGWDPEPKCFKQCEHKRGFLHGNFIYQSWQKFIEGNEISFSCDMGYHPEQQEAKAKCTKSGWSPIPRCLSKDASCGNPPPIANGQSVNGTQGRYLPETKVEYHCDEGFSIRGTFSICINGSWTSVPTCKENPCGPPSQVFDASFAQRVTQSYQPGDIVHYVCHPGFAAAEPLSVTCRKGQWTEPPTCEDAACGDPPTVANADIVSGRREVYKPDHHVQYQCHKGFEMSGSDTVTCGIMVWSEPPTCEDVRCPPPNEIEHGEIVGRPKERYLPYETVRHQCDPGWSLSGPPVVTCLKKQWTKLPRCLDLERNCGPPPHIQNGDVLDPVRAHYTPGTTLRYKCQNLYLMNGSAEVRCEDGVWTEAPICIEACVISEEDMRRNNIQLKWRNAHKLYTEPGDAMEFICRRNYRPVSPASAFRTQCIQGKVEYPRCVWGPLAG